MADFISLRSLAFLRVTRIAVIRSRKHESDEEVWRHRCPALTGIAGSSCAWHVQHISEILAQIIICLFITGWSHRHTISYERLCALTQRDCGCCCAGSGVIVEMVAPLRRCHWRRSITLLARRGTERKTDRTGCFPMLFAAIEGDLAW